MKHMLLYRLCCWGKSSVVLWYKRKLNIMCSFCCIWKIWLKSPTKLIILFLLTPRWVISIFEVYRNETILELFQGLNEEWRRHLLAIQTIMAPIHCIPILTWPVNPSHMYQTVTATIYRRVTPRSTILHHGVLHQHLH